MRNRDTLPVILCVDDEPTGLSIRKMLLESSGYRVLLARNGSDALATFCAESVDLVVLDYMLPGMDGCVLAQRMRESKPRIPILMLSAYVDLPPEIVAVADRYLIKGQGPEALLSAIAELLNGETHTSGVNPAAC